MAINIYSNPFRKTVAPQPTLRRSITEGELGPGEVYIGSGSPGTSPYAVTSPPVIDPNPNPYTPTQDYDPLTDPNNPINQPEPTPTPTPTPTPSTDGTFVGQTRPIAGGGLEEWNGTAWVAQQTNTTGDTNTIAFTYEYDGQNRITKIWRWQNGVMDDVPYADYSGIWTQIDAAKGMQLPDLKTWMTNNGFKFGDATQAQAGLTALMTQLNSTATPQLDLDKAELAAAKSLGFSAPEGEADPDAYILAAYREWRGQTPDETATMADTVAAQSLGMTLEEYRSFRGMTPQEQADYADNAAAQSLGMTLEEYRDFKTMSPEEQADYVDSAAAQSMGMTLEQYRAWKMKSTADTGDEEAARSLGMTLEEYRAMKGGTWNGQANWFSSQTASQNPYSGYGGIGTEMRTAYDRMIRNNAVQAESEARRSLDQILSGSTGNSSQRALMLSNEYTRQIQDAQIAGSIEVMNLDLQAKRDQFDRDFANYSQKIAMGQNAEKLAVDAYTARLNMAQGVAQGAYQTYNTQLGLGQAAATSAMQNYQVQLGIGQTAADNAYKAYLDKFNAGQATAQDVMEAFRLNRESAMQGYATQIDSILKQNQQYLDMYGIELDRITAAVDLIYKSIQMELETVDAAISTRVQEAFDQWVANYGLNQQIGEEGYNDFMDILKLLVALIGAVSPLG